MTPPRMSTGELCCSAGLGGRSCSGTTGLLCSSSSRPPEIRPPRTAETSGSGSGSGSSTGCGLTFFGLRRVCSIVKPPPPPAPTALLMFPAELLIDGPPKPLPPLLPGKPPLPLSSRLPEVSPPLAIPPLLNALPLGDAAAASPLGGLRGDAALGSFFVMRPSSKACVTTPSPPFGAFALL